MVSLCIAKTSQGFIIQNTRVAYVETQRELMLEPCDSIVKTDKSENELHFARKRQIF